MKERRSARVGTVSGLALLAGGTAFAAVAGGTHSFFATVLLGMLTVGMSHALLTELKRQARRRNTDGWAAQDTVNTVLLASWAGGALVAALLAVAPAAVRAVALALTLGYAVSCAYFVAERWRTIADLPAEPVPEPVSESHEIPPEPSRHQRTEITVADPDEAPVRHRTETRVADPDGAPARR